MTLHQVAEEYGNHVALIFRQFPISSHPLALPGAMATECAGGQGKFWEMSDAIFNDQQNLSENSFEGYAQELGLNVDQFNSCMADEKYKDKIMDDYNSGIDFGVRGTPSNFINNQMVPGAVPYENIKNIIDGLLSE